MTYEEFKSVKIGDGCVIIRTGEPCIVIDVNRKTSQIRLRAKRVVVGIVNEWFNYCLLGKI